MFTFADMFIQAPKKASSAKFKKFFFKFFCRLVAHNPVHKFLQEVFHGLKKMQDFFWYLKNTYLKQVQIVIMSYFWCWSK